MSYRLRNWKILYCRTRSGVALMRLRGEVLGNPRYVDGAEVTISTLSDYRLEGSDVLVITHSGSNYLLGKPNPDEPEAVNRVLRQLNAQNGQPSRDSSDPEGTKP
jgi:hypothetical protein